MKNDIINMPPEVIKKIDASVAQVFGAATIQGFERAHVVAKAIHELKSLLTDEYMEPIMQLQGSRLGFRTDQDKKGGYTVQVVRVALIEAVLMGLQPYGNQFNIIAGNMYATKEGLGAVLNRKDLFPKLKKSIIVGLPHINADRTSSAFNVKIKWSNGGDEREEIVPIPIKIDQYASVDSMVGKATRKARAWLFSELIGVEVGEGEIEDSTYTVLASSKPGTHEKQRQRMFTLITGAKTIEELKSYRKDVPDEDLEMYMVYESKANALTNGAA